MANMIKDLLAPDQAKLLDDQLRRRQLQEGVTNYGNDAMGKFLTAASGAQRASAGFGMAAERAVGGRQIGANEAKAIAQQEMLKKQEAIRKAKEAEEQRRWDAEFGLRETQSKQQTVLFNQSVAQNAFTLKQAKNRVQREGQFAVAIEDIVNGMQGLTDTQKMVAETLPAAEGLKYLDKIEQKRIKTNEETTNIAKITSRFFQGAEGKPIGFTSSTGMNNRYLGAIAAANKAGLTDYAAQLEEERKARVEQKKTVEEAEQSVKEKWDTNKSVQTSKSRIGASSQGLALLRQGGGISELAAQVSFFKTIDPESVVKETEIEMANNAAGLLNSLSAAAKKAGGEGVLSDSLKKQLEDFFTLSGNMAVESYNNKLTEQKLRYKGRDMDVEFMFGGEASLNSPIQDRPSDYSFNLNNMNQPVNEDIIRGLGNSYSDLGSEAQEKLLAAFNTVANDPEGQEALQQQAKNMYGFDALGYALYQQRGR